MTDDVSRPIWTARDALRLADVFTLLIEAYDEVSLLPDDPLLERAIHDLADAARLLRKYGGRRKMVSAIQLVEQPPAG